MVKLLKLLPYQISERWDWVWSTIEPALPTFSNIRQNYERENNVLAALLGGKLEYLLFLVDDGNEVKIKVAMTVAVIETIDESGKQLLIYSIYGLRMASKEEWLEGFELLKKYAMSKHCVSIVAYTNLKSVAEMVRRLGGNADFTFLKLEV